MGKLARLGIFGGMKLPVEGVIGAGTRELSPFARKNLGRYGLARIGERLIERVPLSTQDIESLYSSAPLPVLMKLVEYCRPVQVREPQPLLVLPVAEWLKRHSHTDIVELSTSKLQSVPYPRLSVVVDAGGDKEGQIEGALLPEIAAACPGHQINFLRGEDFVSLLLASRVRLEKGPTTKNFLAPIVAELRTQQVDPYAPGAQPALVRAYAERGMAASVFTNLAAFKSSASLARELFRLHELSLDQAIELWVPSYETKTRRPEPAHIKGARDYQLLRLLAVGSLALPHIPYRNASTRYFSLDAVPLARLCGANDLGFGAVDDFSARVMRIEHLERLQRSLAQASSREPVEVPPLPAQLFPEA
ncbi:MAG: hypothetical protein K1X79_05400 [Oligoflexia bacterium]|nr:hypothetical protein [Oligoflexia bacterium]